MSRGTGNGPGGGIRVLLYHAVTAAPQIRLGWRERKYWMTLAEFRAHVALLGASGSSVLPLARAWRVRAAATPSRPLLWPAPEAAPVVLAFDDGHASDASLVWPILREAGLPATFFVNTATLGKPGYLRWSEVREMSAQGASFASHGHHHVDFTALAPRQLDVELRMSKDLIEGWIGRPVDFFAAPYGRVNRRVRDAAIGAGYRAVCTSEPRLARAGAALVSRVAIHRGTTEHRLIGILQGRRFPYWARRVRAACLAGPKLLLPTPGPQPAGEAGGMP